MTNREKLRQALELVAQGLESGALADHYNQSRFVADITDCNSPQCALGWAHAALWRAYPDKDWFHIIAGERHYDIALHKLYQPNPYPQYRNPTPQEAVFAIRGYLAGEPDPWKYATVQTFRTQAVARPTTRRTAI